jgi:hypothetical protein
VIILAIIKGFRCAEALYFLPYICYNETPFTAFGKTIRRKTRG